MIYFVFLTEPARKLQVKRVHPSAIMPKRCTAKAAGIDLYASSDVQVQVRTRRLIPTGIRIILPPNTFGKIEARSSMAYFLQLDVVGGVIDEDYQGEIKVIVVNNNPDCSIPIKKGDRVAQLVIHDIKYYEPIEISDKVVIHPTARGKAGFGSTGI